MAQQQNKAHRGAELLSHLDFSSLDFRVASLERACASSWSKSERGVAGAGDLGGSPPAPAPPPVVLVPAFAEAAFAAAFNLRDGSATSDRHGYMGRCQMAYRKAGDITHFSICLRSLVSRARAWDSSCKNTLRGEEGTSDSGLDWLELWARAGR